MLGGTTAMWDNQRKAQGGEIRMPPKIIDQSCLIWRKALVSSFADGCVEVAHADRTIAVRDSKSRTGPMLCFGTTTWQAFLARVKDGGLSLIRLSSERGCHLTHFHEIVSVNPLTRRYGMAVGFHGSRAFLRVPVRTACRRILVTPMKRFFQGQSIPQLVRRLIGQRSPDCAARFHLFCAAMLMAPHFCAHSAGRPGSR